MSLTGRPVTPKHQKRKRHPRPSGNDLIRQAQARGPEREYLDWLRTQPSALGTGFDYDWNLGLISTPAHWRTAANAGTAIKPEYLALPLLDAEHKLAHHKGDSAIGTREWWESECEKHLKRWLAT